MGIWTLLPVLCSGVSAQEQPLVRVNTRLVEVDVAVRSHGAPVTGLKQNDFSVFDQGKAQKIATFSVTSTEDRPSGIPMPKGAVSNRMDADGREPAAQLLSSLID